MHQLAHQIFHISAHVPCLAEFRGVRFHKRHFDQVSNVFDQISFADPGRSDQNHVLFDVFNLLRTRGVFSLKTAQIIGMVVMIANCDRQHLLRFILLDHEPVEMRFNVPRQKVELEFLLIGLVRFFFLFRWRGLRLGKSRH